MDIRQFRAAYPQYNDMSDRELVDSFHAKYYADTPREKFYEQVGLKEPGFIETVKQGFSEGVESQGAGFAVVRGASDDEVARQLADTKKSRPTPGYEKFQSELEAAQEKFNNASGAWDATRAAISVLGTFASHPKQVARDVSASMGSSIPQRAGSVAAGAAIGSVVPGVGTAIGAAVGWLLSGYSTNIQGEAAAALDEALSKAGVDTSNPEEVKRALARNPNLMGDVRGYAIQKGAATATMEGVVDIGTLGLGRLAKIPASVLGRVGRSSAVVGASGVQEAAGSVAGSKAVGEEINPGQVLSEGVLGAIAGAPELGAAVRLSRPKAPGEATAATPEAEAPAQQPTLLLEGGQQTVRPDNWEVVNPEAQRLPGQQSPLALPSPAQQQPEIIVDSQGNATPVSAAYTAAKDEERQRMADLGLTPDVARAQAMRSPAEVAQSIAQAKTVDEALLVAGQAADDSSAVLRQAIEDANGSTVSAVGTQSIADVSRSLDSQLGASTAAVEPARNEGVSVAQPASNPAQTQPISVDPNLAPELSGPVVSSQPLAPGATQTPPAVEPGATQEAAATPEGFSASVAPGASEDTVSIPAQKFSFAKAPVAPPTDRAARMASVNASAQRMAKGWQNAPKIQVIDSIDQAPASVRAEAQRVGGTVEAFAEDDTVFLVADALPTEQDAQRVLLHESVGHMGLQGAFGDGMAKVLDLVGTFRPDLIRDKAAQYKLDGSVEGKRLAAEEALASIAESNPKATLVRRAISAIRSWLRDKGFKVRLTDSDIVAQYILPAMRFIEKAQLTKPKTAEVRLSRQAFADRIREFEQRHKKPDRSSYLGDLNPAQEAAARRVGAIVEPTSMVDKASGLGERLKKSFIQGMFDQYAPIKEVSQEAYMQARLSKGADGSLEALLLYGKPFLRDGVADVKVDKDGKGGFAAVLASLDGEQDRFLWWVAAKRAERLKAEGRENLFTSDDISALGSLNKPDAKHPERNVKFNKALVQLNEYNESVLRIAQESGLLDKEAVEMFRSQPYVPFFRAGEDGEVKGQRFSKGLVNQKGLRKLKGGSDKLNQDLLGNLLRNWSSLFSAAAKNRAALETMKAAEPLGVVHEVSVDEKGSVKVWEDGKAKSYLIDDPHLMQAVSALAYATPGWFKPFSAFKRMLSFGVTINPTYRIRNLIRDSIAAMAQAELSYNPAKNIRKGLEASSHNSQLRASMLASGGMLRMGLSNDGDSSKQAQKLIRKAKEAGTWMDEAGWKKIQGQIGSVWETYQELGDRAENINRAALYERLIEKGHSHKEASFMARDLLDFSMSGTYPVVRFLTQSVPFMNARLQGLYKLGRAAKENPRRFGYVAGGVALASLSLLWAYGDDEDWKKREDFDRDGSWAFKIGDLMFRIPKPFEVGAIGTIAERTWELFFDPEMDTKRYMKRLADMGSQTFAMSPVPQLVKPFFDLYSNKDSFTGRDIETDAMQKLRPEDRYTSRTSEPAKWLAKSGFPDPAQFAMGRYSPLSPVQFDHLARAYFGWLGTGVMTVADEVARYAGDGPEKPDKKLKETFLVGNFIETLPSGSSRYVSALYERSRVIEETYASYRAAIREGDVDKARELKEDNPKDFRERMRVNAAKKKMTEISERIRKVERSPAPGEFKRREIDRLEQQRNAIARAASIRTGTEVESSESD